MKAIVALLVLFGCTKYEPTFNYGTPVDIGGGFYRGCIGNVTSFDAEANAYDLVLACRRNGTVRAVIPTTNFPAEYLVEAK